MRSVIILLAFSLTSHLAFSQKTSTSDTTGKKNQKTSVTEEGSSKKDPESGKVHVTPGSSGVKRSIGYRFSALTGDADPGNGIFRYNHQNASGITYIFLDDKDVSGEDQTSWYSTWDDITGAMARGRLTVADMEGKIINVFNVTGLFIDAQGFWKIPVQCISGIQPRDGSVYYYVFERIAHQDASGKTNQGTEVAPGNQVVPITVSSEIITAPKTENVTPEVQVNQGSAVTPAQQPDQGNRETRVIAGTGTVVASQAGTRPAGTPENLRPRETQTGQRTTGTQGSQDKTATRTSQGTRQSPGTEGVQNRPTVVVPQTSQGTQRTTGLQSTPVNPATPAGQGTQPAAATQSTQNPQTAAVVQNSQGTQTGQTTQNRQTTQVYPGTQTAQSTQSKPATQTYQGAQAVQSPQRTTVGPPNQVNQYTVTQNNTQTQGVKRRKWYRGIIEAGYGLGLGDYGINNFRFNFINAVRIGQCFSIGLGIGYRYYFEETRPEWYLVSEKSQIPVFLDLRTTFSTKKLTPYLALGIGGSSVSDSTENSQNGLLFTTSGGIWYNVSDRFAVFAGIAYELHNLEFSATKPYTNSYFKNSNALSLNVGISF